MMPTCDDATADLLGHLAIEVECCTCNTTSEVPAALVRDSQRLLAEGCSGTSLFECDASFYATLVAPDAVAALEHAWLAFRRSAASHGGTRVMVTATEPHGFRSDSELRALARWEDDGGRGSS